MTKHERIQSEIVLACEAMGIEAIQEYSGTDWRADVLVPNLGEPIAFEVQLSPQSLRRTVERQQKYIRDGIIGCWLFEKPVYKLNKERPDLPLFYVEDNAGPELLVNLGDRRKVELPIFLDNFISFNIKFRPKALTSRIQTVHLVFYEMECWKCHSKNHLYFVDTPFYSACHAEIRPDESLWASTNMEYRPEIVSLARAFAESTQGQIKLGAIKPRYSRTVDDTYMSFGCSSCDSIFGDWYVMEAKMEMIYGPEEITCTGEIELNETIELDLPHWCFPDDEGFCT